MSSREYRVDGENKVFPITKAGYNSTKPCGGWTLFWIASDVIANHKFPPAESPVSIILL